MNFRFLVCCLLASMSHAGILLVLPSRTPPMMRSATSDFSVEILPTHASAGSFAASAKPEKLPNYVSSAEFQSARLVDTYEPRSERSVTPPTAPSRALRLRSETVAAAEIVPASSQADVVDSPTEVPPIHSAKPSHVIPTGPAAPLVKQGTRTLPRIGGDFHPAFPDEARRLGLEGMVVLEIVVSKSGEVKSARIDKSSGHELLDHAALRDVRKARFQPGRIGDKPSEMTALLPLSYRLIDSP